jgi:hypothetical protein
MEDMSTRAATPGKYLDIFKIDGTTLTPASPQISLGDDHPASMAASPKQDLFIARKTEILPTGGIHMIRGISLCALSLGFTINPKVDRRGRQGGEFYFGAFGEVKSAFARPAGSA